MSTAEARVLKANGIALNSDETKIVPNPNRAAADRNSLAMRVAYDMDGEDVGKIIMGETVPFGQQIPRGLVVKLIGDKKPVRIGDRVYSIRSAKNASKASPAEVEVLEANGIVLDSQQTKIASGSGGQNMLSGATSALVAPGATTTSKSNKYPSLPSSLVSPGGSRVAAAAGTMAPPSTAVAASAATSVPYRSFQGVPSVAPATPSSVPGSTVGNQHPWFNGTLSKYSEIANAFGANPNPSPRPYAVPQQVPSVAPAAPSQRGPRR